MNENYLAMIEGVSHFLQKLGLPQYYDTFVNKGYDMETDLLELDDQDLNLMGIINKGHRSVIKSQALNHGLTPEYKLYEWLKENGLDYYFVNFINGELVNLDDIAKLHLPDEKLYDELEILLPGHQKRLRTAVRKLRKKRRGMSPEFETPVTEGWWGKPEFLQEAKYDFLCVDAILSSSKENAFGSERLQFMVDSGSDVVTVRQEVLDRLDLELIGPIQSRGVHASRTKNLYRAHLLIGNEELEIEVMGETYDSIGSRVIRHFRHYISGGRHVWLKGDYYDPSMSPKERITSPQITTDIPKSDQQQMGPSLQQIGVKKESLTMVSGTITDIENPSAPATTQHSIESLPFAETTVIDNKVHQAKSRPFSVPDEDCPAAKRQKLLEDDDDSVDLEKSGTSFIKSQASLHLSSSSKASEHTSPATSHASDVLLVPSHLDLDSSHSIISYPSPVPTLISPLSSSASEHSLPFPVNENDNTSNDSEIVQHIRS
ncbi:hypothetical protein LOTGIDRAFT_232164 [Lottia gigantea]|uniref:SAM domain-containing protein n=1 Tax=Lottia gigantea TaxID=225164 RepID=V4ADW3_LOTGI|nr:hypothetical protein LOTGIDRAFT_232164 [Lottia gigantea]ESO95047.1 hypothetical protein LOTGIDRAFT_232164 [Lottia gigantea]